MSILSGLSERKVLFAMGSSVYDWGDPFGRMFLQILAVVAEFEANLIKMRTREGMAVARAKGKLRGRAPKLSRTQQAHLIKLYGSGEHSISELAELFSIARPTVYRVLQHREKEAAPAS
jgi:DNA invertase Pin-like site-specific DNA recombinase